MQPGTVGGKVSMDEGFGCIVVVHVVVVVDMLLL